MEKASYLNAIRVILISSEFYGKRPLSVDEIIEKLQIYDRDKLNIVLTKWMLLLRRRGAHSMGVQVLIAKKMINRSQYKRLRNKYTGRKNRLMLIEDVILALIKLNLANNDNGGLLLADSGDAKGLFKLVISLNEHYVGDQKMSADDIVKPGSQKFENLRYAMAKQSLGISSSEILYQMYRGKVLVDNITVINPEFGSIFENKMGMSVQDFQEILFLLLIDWGVPAQKKTLEEFAVKDFKKYFSNLSISSDKVNSVVDYLSVSSETFAEENQRANAAAGLQDEINNLAVFYTKPLLKINSELLCLSPDALAMQLTDAPYNVVREVLKDVGDQAKIQQLPNDWGRAYEQYILSLLRATFGDLLIENVKIKSTGQDSIDALLLFDEVAFLIEIKYPHWKFASRQNPTSDAITAHIQKFVSDKKGLGQIKTFIEKAKNNDILNDPDLSGKLLVPVLILGENFPFDPFNRELIEKYATENGFLPTGKEVLPYIILNSSEIELLEGIVETLGVGHARDALMVYSYALEKAKRQEYRDRPTTFWNIYTTNNIIVEHGTDMKKHLDQFTEHILASWNVIKRDD